MVFVLQAEASACKTSTTQKPVAPNLGLSLSINEVDNYEGHIKSNERVVNGRLGIMWKKELFYIFKLQIQTVPEEN